MNSLAGQTFSLQLFSRNDFRVANEMISCVQLQVDMLPWMVPTHFGWHEPLNIPFDSDDVSKIISESGKGETVFWKTKGGGRFRGSWSVPWISGVSHLGNTHSDINLYGCASAAKFPDLIDYLRESAVSNNCDFAYLDVATKSAAKDFPGSSVDYGRFQVVTHTLREFLPNMFWGSVFGPAYIELFGIEKLLSTPAFIRQQISSDHVYIQLTESLTDTVNFPQSLHKARERVKHHLGVEHFYVAGVLEESLPARVAPKFGFDGVTHVARPWSGTEPTLLSDEIINEDVHQLALLLTSSEDSAIPLTGMQRQNLDFSIESISILEAALEFQRENLGEDADKLNKIILQVGSYVGEVIRRFARSDLNWIDYEAAVKRSEILENIGPQVGVALVLASNDYGQIFPLAKVQKFLENGSEESLTLFVKVMIS